MTTEERRNTWETYVSAWREPTAEAKRIALQASVDAACTYRDPLTEVQGHGALVDYMLGFHQQIRGGYFQTTYFLAHHDRSIAKWNMRDGNGNVLSDGVSYGEYNSSGKLIAMTGFFDPPPA